MGIGWIYPTLYMSEVRFMLDWIPKLTESELQLSPIALLGSQVFLSSRLTSFSSILASEGRTVSTITPYPTTRDG